MYRIKNENLRRDLDEYTSRDLYDTLARERAQWLDRIPDRLESDLGEFETRQYRRDPW